MLAQRLITLILMMINSYSYSTNDHVFIKFQIFNQDLSRVLTSIKNSKSSFETTHVDSRARASRLHQVLKEESNSWIKFGSSQDGEKDFQEKIFNKTSSNL